MSQESLLKSGREFIKPLYYDLIRRQAMTKKKCGLCRTGLVKIGGELVNIRKSGMVDEI